MNVHVKKHSYRKHGYLGAYLCIWQHHKIYEWLNMDKYEKLKCHTSRIFEDWLGYLKKLSQQADSDIVIEDTNHSQQRGRERGITTGQIRHILQNILVLEHIQKSTRQGYFKFRIIGHDFDDNEITVVVIPAEMGTGYKVVTAFLSNNLEKYGIHMKLQDE